MRSPTTLLFSLVIGAVILVATTEKMRVLLGLPSAEEPTTSESISNTLQDAQQEMHQLQSSIQNKIGQKPPPPPEIEPRNIWTWTDDQGVRHFSDEPPPEGTASERMVIKPAPVADNSQVPPPPKASPQPPEEAPAEQRSNLIQGLKNFQEYQRAMREAEHGR